MSAASLLTGSSGHRPQQVENPIQRRQVSDEIQAKGHFNRLKDTQRIGMLQQLDIRDR